MLIFNGQVRLTPKELEQYRKDTGVMEPPNTVAEYNRVLQHAADWWRDVAGNPEALLLAHLLEMDKLPMTTTTTEPGRKEENSHG